MTDHCCKLLLPLALLVMLGALRCQTDRLGEQEVQFGRASETFLRHYRAGPGGRVELLDPASAPGMVVRGAARQGCNILGSSVCTERHDADDVTRGAQESTAEAAGGVVPKF